MPAGDILVADDDAAIRTVLNQALSRAGYQVRSTSNAATLWRWISQGEGNLVITDVVMPDENAFDLLPRIKKMRPDLPVIVMSAQNTFITAVRASEKGAYEYLPKPFDLKELIGIVGRALSDPKERSRPPTNQSIWNPSPWWAALLQCRKSIAFWLVSCRPIYCDDHRQIRNRQGAGCARPARLWQTPEWTLCGNQYGGHSARPDKNQSCLATRRARSPGRMHAAQAVSSKPKGARCFSMRSVTCRWRHRRGYCACCSKANIRLWVAALQSRRMYGLSPPRTKIFAF